MYEKRFIPKGYKNPKARKSEVRRAKSDPISPKFAPQNFELIDIRMYNVRNSTYLLRKACTYLTLLDREF